MSVLLSLQGQKRTAEGQLDSQRAKRKRLNEFQWSPDELAKYSGPQFLLEELKKNTAALNLRMAELFDTLASPLQFKTSFPAGLSEKERQSFFEVAKQAGLFSFQNLVSPNGYRFLVIIENACKQRNSSLAIELIKSGLIVSVADIDSAMKYNLPDVLTAIIEKSVSLPLSRFFASFTWACENRHAALVEACFCRVGITSSMWKKAFQDACLNGLQITARVLLARLKNMDPERAFLSSTEYPSSLHEAVIQGDIDQLKRLVANLIQEERQDILAVSWGLSGQTVVRLAHVFQEREMVELLIEAQKDRKLIVKKISSFDSQEFSVNSSLLSSHSFYFKGLFERGFKEKYLSESVIFEDELEAMGQILEFLYTQDLPIDSENFATFGHLACKYMLVSVKQQLEYWIEKHPDYLVDEEVLSLLVRIPAPPARPTPLEINIPLEDEIKDLSQSEQELLQELVFLKPFTSKVVLDACKKGWSTAIQFMLQNGVATQYEAEVKTPLMYACEYGHIEIVRMLLDAGALITALDKNKVTALHYAAGKGKGEICEALLEHLRYDESQTEETKRAFINLANSHGDTPLIMACSSGHQEVAQALLRAGADVWQVPEDGWTALHCAVSKGMREIFEAILERIFKDASRTEETKRAFISRANSHGDTPLILACGSGLPEVAQALLRAGADVWPVPEDGWSALHRAANKGWCGICEAILERIFKDASRSEETKRAFINRANSHGDTPLIMACSLGHQEVAQALLRAGADVWPVPQDGWSALDCAVSKGMREICKTILERIFKDASRSEEAKRAFISQANSHGDTPLMLACGSGLQGVAQAFLLAGADVWHVSENGWTALHSAVSKGMPEICEAILERIFKDASRSEEAKRAFISQANSHGDTPLIFACSSGLQDVAQALLLAGADVWHVSEDGWTALHGAAERGWREICEAILERIRNDKSRTEEAKRAFISQANSHGDTPLILARKKGHKKILEINDLLIAETGWTILDFGT